MPASSCDDAFQTFRQALLSGANDDSRVILQVSPDKNVIFRCTSSPFTWTGVWERLRDDWLTRLPEPARPTLRVGALTFLFVASQLW